MKHIFYKSVLIFTSLVIFEAELAAQGVGNFFQPNLLLGGAGVAAEADLDNIMLNPAQLGHLKYSGAQFAWAMHNQEYQQRYPGFPAHSSTDGGLEDFPTPSFAYKFNKKFGITGFAIPFPVEIEIDKRGLPLIALNQQNTVDLIGKGRSEALFLGGLGYAFNSSFAVGLSVNYLAFSGEFAMAEATTGNELVAGTIEAQNFSAGIGIKMKMKKFSLGVFVQGINSASTTLGITGGSLAQAQSATGGQNASEGQSLGGKNESSSFANPIRLGLAIKVTSKITLLADAEYTRKTDGNMFSVVDLAEKPRDSYDTLAVFAGVDIKLPRHKQMYLGYRNIPSAIGPGTQGENGKAGFGFISLIENLGGAPSRPIWAMSAGYRQYFGKKIRKGRRAPKAMFGEVGFIYEEVSIGIDETGEQPGAYLVRDIRIPFKFGYRF